MGICVHDGIAKYISRCSSGDISKSNSICISVDVWMFHQLECTFRLSLGWAIVLSPKIFVFQEVFRNVIQKAFRDAFRKIGLLNKTLGKCNSVGTSGDGVWP